MDITYKDHKKFNRAELEELFLSVNWSSGHYPDLLVEALRNYGSVFSAWDGDKLVGLAASMASALAHCPGPRPAHLCTCCCPTWRHWCWRCMRWCCWCG